MLRMNRSQVLLLAALVSAIALAAPLTSAADLTKGMKSGKLQLKSAGPLSFGPEGILFAGDPMAATVVAVATGDKGPRSSGALDVEGVDKKVAARLGTSSDGIRIVDMAVNPASGAAYLSVARGQGDAATAVIVRVAQDGSVDELSLDDVMHSQTELPKAPGADETDRRGLSKRIESITDLSYVAGTLFVAGLSNEEFASQFRTIPFPFSEVEPGTGVGIFHGSHNRFETASPVRTFVPYEIDNEPHILAAYTCTPLVKVPVSDLQPGAQVKGTTVAELGNRNRPLDMVVYHDGGKDYVLMANSSRGVMKIAMENIGDIDPITEGVKDTAGLPYETIDELRGVEQLDRFDDEQALLLVKTESGSFNLQTIPLP